MNEPRPVRKRKYSATDQARLTSRIAFSLRGTLATLHNELLDLGGVAETSTRKVGFPLNGAWDYAIDSMHVDPTDPSSWEAFISDSLQFMGNGAFNTTFMSGKEYRDWVEKAEATHKSLMTNAGFLAAKK